MIIVGGGSIRMLRRKEGGGVSISLSSFVAMSSFQSDFRWGPKQDRLTRREKKKKKKGGGQGLTLVRSCPLLLLLRFVVLFSARRRE